jgi:ribosomal protein S18 acetylase RimI-like enzyme
VHYDAPLYRHRRWAEIVGLYLEPEHRGQGTAAALMQHAYDWAVQHRLRVMQLYVTASNHRAQRFYTREGFTTSQIIMRRILSDDEQEFGAPASHHAGRLHFSEGGTRRLDMHERMHNREPHGDRHSDS